MATYELDFSNVDRVENDIHVKFNTVVTVPVHKDGKNTGMALYIGLTNIAAWVRGMDTTTTQSWRSHAPEDAAMIMDIAGRLKLADEIKP